MPNALYDKAREAFLNGEISWMTDTIKVVLVTNGYTPNFSTDVSMDSVGSANIIGTPQTLTNKTSGAGVADAGDVSFTGVTGTVAAIVIFKQNTTGAGTLIAYLNQINGLPIQNANNNSLTIHWDNGTNKIFKL